MFPPPISGMSTAAPLNVYGRAAAAASAAPATPPAKKWPTPRPQLEILVVLDDDATCSLLLSGQVKNSAVLNMAAEASEDSSRIIFESYSEDMYHDV